ncbi:GNAT family N-acetyltransferase [Glycomyces tarimensis]
MIVATDYSGDAEAVADRIASAFATLAVAEWLVPGDLAERHRLLAGQFAMLVGPALDGHGHVDAAIDEGGSLAGVAVWFDYTKGPIPGPPDYERRLEALCGPRLPRFQALDAAFERGHPDPEQRPHQHLAFCAVAPEHQRRGLGSQLLSVGLDRLDRLGAAGYLEAANLPLTDWYGKHGFERREALRLPEGPSMYPMWRNVPTAAAQRQR